MTLARESFPLDPTPLDSGLASVQDSKLLGFRMSRVSGRKPGVCQVYGQPFRCILGHPKGNPNFEAGFAEQKPKF